MKKTYLGEEILTGKKLKEFLKNCDEDTLFFKDTGDFESFYGYIILNPDMTIRELLNIMKKKDIFNDIMCLNREEFLDQEGLNDPNIPLSENEDSSVDDDIYDGLKVIDLDK